MEMEIIKKVPYEPIYVDTIPDILEEGKVYVSELHGCAIHNCLCGCGEKTVMALEPIWKNGWNLIKENNGTVSFTPSVGNFRMDCKSHYVMTKGIANFI